MAGLAGQDAGRDEAGSVVRVGRASRRVSAAPHGRGWGQAPGRGERGAGRGLVLGGCAGEAA